MATAKKTEAKQDNATTIAGAIVRVISEVERLDKSSTNTFDNYKFASIDEFLDRVGKLCAKHGVYWTCDEVECEILSRAGKPWLRFRFELQVHHVSGESLEPCHRTVFVPFSGAQASGSAQSYAIKQFLRGQFAVACGDNDDPDYQPAVSDPVDRVEYADATEISQIRSLLKEGGWDEAKTLKRLGLRTWNRLEKERVPEVIERLAIALEGRSEAEKREQLMDAVEAGGADKSEGV